MRPKLTWKVPSWSKAGWVDSYPEIVARFGIDAARIVIRVRRMLDYRRDLPGSQDVRHTLQTIAKAPTAVDVGTLDDHADAVLTEAAWGLRKVLDLRELSAAELAQCAEHALAKHGARSGPPESDDLVLLLVAQLLSTPAIAYVPPGWDCMSDARLARALAARRDDALTDALLACNLSAGQKTIERLLTRVRAG